MQGKLRHATSCFLKQALDRGAEKFKWQKSGAQSETDWH